VGDVVEEGQPLVVLEAMKMENVIKAAANGTVSAVEATQYQAVEKGALLVGFEA
jgi:biotin carboxyl carrier protein